MTSAILDCTEAEYHADPCESPSLNASTAHTILSRSPYHAWVAHPRLGRSPQRSSRSLQLGTLIHALVLGTDPLVEVIDAPDFRSRAAQEQRDAALAAGMIPMRQTEYLEIQVAAATIRRKAAEKGIRFDGQSEVKVRWHEGDVLCRGMIDHAKGSSLYDLKTITSADLRTIAKHMSLYGYDVQRAAYVSAWEHLHPELVGAIDFVFVFAETEPPYCVTPVRVDSMRQSLGEMQWARACATWARCLKEDRWPDYTDGIATIGCREWELAEEMEKERTS